MSRLDGARITGGIGGAVVVVGVLAMVTLGIAVDRLVSAPEIDILRSPPVPTAIQGAWYCAAGETVEGDDLEVAALSPQRVSNVHVEAYAEGEIDPVHRMRLEPMTVQSRELEDGVEDLGIIAVWEHAPAVVGRTWRLGEERDVSGTVHGPCVTEISSEWYLTGAATDGGAVAQLVVTNPFETDAAINVSLSTDEGSQAPELLQNVGVPARTTRTIELNEFAPERADLGALVTRRSGRVIVEGWQSVDPAIGDIAGVALTRLATAPAERWTIPWVPIADAESWVTVSNVGEETASVRLVVHTGEGARIAEDIDEVSVPAGSVRRIDLGAAFPEDVVSGGITIISEGEVPIVAAAVTRIADEDVERTGILHLLGHPEPHTRWLMPVAPGEDRRTALHLVNPTESSARVHVTLLTPDGDIDLDELRDIGIGPGAQTTLDIDEHVPDEVEVYGVLVTSRASSVVAALHSYERAGARHGVVNGGIAGVTGRTPLERRHVAPEPGMTRRLGTSLGPRVALLEEESDDGTETDIEDEAGTPTP